MIIKNIQKLPEAPNKKRGDASAKKRNRPDKRKNLVLFQQWPSEWHHLNLMPVAEGATRPSLDDTLANLFTSRSRLFY